MKSIKYYLKIFTRVASISTSSMLIYRGNIAFFFVFETLFLAANLTGLSMGVDFAGGSLNGWNKEEVIFVAMFYQVSHQFFSTFFMSGLFHIGWYVWSGRMDYVLLKPLHPLIGMHTATEFIISNTPNLLINCGLFGWSWIHMTNSGQQISTLGALMLPLFFLVAIGVRYGLALLVISPTFFTEKASDAEDAYWSIQGLAKYPKGVFPLLVQHVFSFVLPIVTISAIPSAMLFGKETGPNALIALVVGVVFLMGTLALFNFAVTRYQSVNTGA
jgi:ABC-2 type transport system permease protein